MAPLSNELRRQLKNAVEKARDEAEAGARKALDMLAVGHHEPHGSMSLEQRDLRRRLRDHGRQLGDTRDPRQGTQAVDLLVQEVAYEHWHRMLFARFLAENDLLIEPTSQQPVTMEDCEELAREAGENPYGMAARFAQASLPQIFRPDSPVFELHLPPEHQQQLERLIDTLSPEVYAASDSLGWVYQFWQTKRKDAVNESGVKIGARELAPVTQLFTEPYMVSFLLDNSLGAWWAARRLSDVDLQTAASEDELRRKAAIPGVPLEYLRFVRADDGKWTPAAGVFARWPQHLRDFRAIDPCCGSGHFLVAALHMLAPMRMEMEGLPAREAVDAVLRENLHGLELDERCVELAAFALAMAAWTYPDSGGHRRLPELHLACSGASAGVSKDDWQRLGGDDQNLRIALGSMYDLFRQAPVLGSLIDPASSKFLNIVTWEQLSKGLQFALQDQKPDDLKETSVAAQGLARSATLLSGEYHWVITNVPYLARGKQDDALRVFCQDNYGEAKNDLATVFLERCLRMCAEGGTTSVVLPQNWLFLTSYRKLREKLLKRDTWHVVARLGEGGFESTSAAGAFVALLIMSKGQAQEQRGGLFGAGGAGLVIRGLDTSARCNPPEKAASLIYGPVVDLDQDKQLANPDSRVALDEAADLPILNETAWCFAGILNGDSLRFQRRFWELVERLDMWALQQTTVRTPVYFGGLKLVIYFDVRNGHLREDAAVRRDKLHDSDRRGNRAWGGKGVSISQMRSLPASLYTGEVFDSNIAVIYPEEQSSVVPIWCYCVSADYQRDIRRIDQKLNVTNATLVKVPFDHAHWTKVAQERYPHGLPAPYSDDPTQWIFHGHPCGSVIWDDSAKRTADGPLRTDSTVLQVAVARLLGYRWPAEQDPDMDLAQEQRAWVDRCSNLQRFADADGIVCLPPLRGERGAADRLREILAAAYGDKWSHDTERALLAAAANGQRVAADLETWLRDGFFEQHCKLFDNSPFIWHIWDGLRDGFHCLVNAHRLTGPGGAGRRTLEAILYSYLGPWIQRQQADQQEGKEGADARLVHARDLAAQLEKILAGEPPLDLFVRWKPLHQQPIGWEPDINDGIRLNIRPFLTAELRSGGRQGAGLLRAKANIKWNKDRGKDPESLRPRAEFPWFWSCPGGGVVDFAGGKNFDGNRWNDLHYSNAVKLEARRERGEGKTP